MSRLIKALLVVSLFCIHIQSDAASNTNNHITVSPAERAKIETVVHQYLISKPEVLVEAMQVLQHRQYEEAQQTVKKTEQNAPQYISALFNQANDPIAGNPNGKVIIVEFFDYQCPHCVDMAPVMDAIIKANSNVRVVFKEFPIRGPMSEFAARAALAANKQGKYYQFSHAMLTTKQPLTEDTVYAIAKEQGLDVEKLKHDINDKSIDTQLKSNIKLAQDLKLFGTPAFFIGKLDASSSNAISYTPGQMNQKQMQSLIDQIEK
ncbi:MAG TPA: DsbA family protein [Gammaproteobacteria bacterium]|nr:DsbA family protein [Gammaproteobacteria bacterium]